ncbi:hypothetical protein M0R45_003016 [Rubus argutus]|uniref:Integrase catalytic domain-containing protein n=1 Tax=Rubus argutus TaxID=59490 RepID=A0AAW1YF74_RUBAR
MIGQTLSSARNLLCCGTQNCFRFVALLTLLNNAASRPSSTVNTGSSPMVNSVQQFTQLSPPTQTTSPVSVAPQPHYVPIPAIPYGFGQFPGFDSSFGMSGFYAGQSSNNSGGGTGYGRAGNGNNGNNYGRQGGNGGFNRSAGNNGGNIFTCQLCGKVGHSAKTCRTLANFQKNSSSSNSVECQYCGRPYHTADKCFEIIGFPNQQQQQNQGSQGSMLQNHGGAAMMASTTTPQYWLADSGATNHMTNEVQLLQNLAPYSNGDTVQIGNGAHLNVTHTGNTKLGSLTLNNVLLIPELAAHLLSIYQLCKQNNCLVWFDEFMCVIQDKVMGKVLYKGLSEQGLYPIPFALPSLLKASSTASTSTTTSHAAFVSKIVPHSLWHKRFGHPSKEVVHSMLNKSRLPSGSDATTTCEDCLLGKFKKLPFSDSHTRSVNPFEIVHSDVWGPSPHLSLDGFKYYVLFIDDCTRYCWIFPMKNKNEVFSYFQSLCAFVKNQFSTTIKCLRSDGGGEYMSTVFKSFMNSNGISHQVSCPYTPEQNGVSERKNRHIRETVVTMLQTASLSSEFWYHACALATYLINRMPTSVLDMSSPFETLYKRLPCLELLRVFGCACYPLMTPYSANKLQPKTV